MKQGSSSRIILITIAVFLIYPVLAFSSSSVLTGFKIPSQIGNVKEVFEATPANLSTGTTIIQIQDAHCNYEAQKNLAAIIEYLIKEKNVNLVMVEGGSGDISLSFLRSYAEKKDRMEIAEKYLKDGKISGEEYLDIISDYNFELYGIEDPALYDSNLDSFLNIESYRAEALKDCASLRKVVEALKQNIYNSGLQRFEEEEAKYDNKGMALADYAAYIKERADNLDLKIEDYPQFSAFLKSSRLEKELDFKEAERQRGIFIKDLATKMTEPEVKELIARSQEFKAQKISGAEYYAFLKDKAEGKIDLAQSYPQMAAYMIYTDSGSRIKPEALLKDIDRIKSGIKEALFSGDDDRQLSRISGALSTLERFLKLDLTPDDYENFIAHKEEFRTASWMDFLSRNCRKYGITDDLAASEFIDGNIDKFNDFYRIGLEREKSFIKNIADKMSLSGDKVAVVITGGFHTSGLSRLFKEKGYSYAVVTPAITQKADPAIYYSVLRGENGEIEDTYLEED